MSRLTVILVLVAVPLAAQDDRYAPLLDELETGRAAPPSLEDILLDVATLVRKADQRDAAVLEGRLREVQDELRLLERIQRTLESGVLVKIPEALLPRLGTAPDPGELARERQRLQELEAEYQLRKGRATPIPVLEAPKGDFVASAGASAFGDAALEVRIDVPEAPKSEAGSLKAVQRATDPVGLAKALYRAGDFSGALNAIDGIEEAKRTDEVLYRRARCLERLGRHGDAEQQYKAVVATAAGGFWGRQAEWMLRFGEMKFGTRDLMTGGTDDATEKGN